MKGPRQNKALSIALCVCGGVASAMSFVIGPEGYVGKSAYPAAGADYLWTALALCFAWLFFRVYRRGGLRPRLIIRKQDVAQHAGPKLRVVFLAQALLAATRRFALGIVDGGKAEHIGGAVNAAIPRVYPADGIAIR